MLYGDQWLCPCGWQNLFLRKVCRHCGEQRVFSRADAGADRAAF
jgi:hypothetical protein